MLCSFKDLPLGGILKNFGLTASFCRMMDLTCLCAFPVLFKFLPRFFEYMVYGPVSICVQFNQCIRWLSFDIKFTWGKASWERLLNRKACWAINYQFTTWFTLQTSDHDATYRCSSQFKVIDVIKKSATSWWPNKGTCPEIGVNVQQEATDNIASRLPLSFKSQWVSLCLTSHQHLRSYGDGATINLKSLIRYWLEL